MELKINQIPEIFRHIFRFAIFTYVSDIYLMEDQLPIFSSVSEKGIALREGFRKILQERFKDDREVNKLLLELRKPIKKQDIQKLLEVIGLGNLKNKEEKNVSFEIFNVREDGGLEPYVRFRVNIARAYGRVVLSLRRLFHHIPNLQELNLPLPLLTATKFNSGLIIIAGQTGSGKSTTLASLLDFINEKYSKIVITLENPIEYFFKPKNSFFIQREVGVDTENFITGIENALRQNPDIIVVGEARTNEEIEATLKSAETGHLTFATLHTNSVVDTIKRITDTFSGNDAKRIRYMLASQIKGIIVQKLLKDRRGLPIPAVEYLFFNTKEDTVLRNLIREGKEENIKQYLTSLPSQSAMSMNKYLMKLISEGKITKDEAMKSTYDPNELEKLLLQHSKI